MFQVNGYTICLYRIAYDKQSESSPPLGPILSLPLPSPTRRHPLPSQIPP